LAADATVPAAPAARRKLLRLHFVDLIKNLLDLSGVHFDDHIISSNRYSPGIVGTSPSIPTAIPLQACGMRRENPIPDLETSVVGFLHSATSARPPGTEHVPRASR
jgi:hypothetical protein